MKQEQQTKELERLKMDKERLQFQNNALMTQHVSNTMKIQELEANKLVKSPTPAPAPAKGLCSYSPFLATFAVAAVAFFIGRR